MRNFLAIIAAAMLICGCGGQWVTLKNGQSVSESEINKDKLYCQREAAVLFPYSAAINSSGGSSSSTSSTNCTKYGSSVDCTTYGGGYRAPTVTTADGNASNREKYYRSCLNALGHKLEFIPDVSDVTTSTNLLSTGSYCTTNSDCGSGEICMRPNHGGGECH